MKKERKHFVLPIAAVLLSLLITGCGKAEPDPNSGVYEGTQATMMGITMDVSEVYENGVSFDIQDGGKCVCNLDGETAKLKWTREGNSIHFEGGGVELDGTIGGGDLLIENMMDMGIDLQLHCNDLLHADLEGEDGNEKSSGSVLARLKDAKAGKNVYSNGASSDERSDEDNALVDATEQEQEEDAGSGSDTDNGETGECSEIAAAKGLDGSWFGPGIADVDTLAELYYHWSDELSWDEKDEQGAGFYDAMVEATGCKPLDDNDEDYMDRAELEYKTEGGGVFGFYLKKNDNGDWVYGGITCAGDVFDRYREIRDSKK